MAEDKDPWGSKALGQAFAMATNMAAALLVGYFLGRYLDNLLNTTPWLTITFFLLGMGTGLKMVYETAFGRIGSSKNGEGDDGKKERFKLKDSLANLKDAQQKLKEDRQRLLREKWIEEHQSRDNAEEDERNPRS